MYDIELDALYRKMGQIRIQAEDDTEKKNVMLFGVRVGDVKKLDNDLWISYNDFYTKHCKDKVLADVENATLAHQMFVFQSENVSSKLSNYGYTLNRLFTNSSFKLDNLDSDHLVNKIATDWMTLEQGGTDHIRVAMMHLYKKEKQWVEKTFPIAKSSAKSFTDNVQSLVEKYPRVIYISQSCNSWRSLKAMENGLVLVDEVERYVQLVDNQRVGE